MDNRTCNALQYYGTYKKDIIISVETKIVNIMPISYVIEAVLSLLFLFIYLFIYLFIFFFIFFFFFVVVV